jgi:hypothetical protein
MFHENKHARLNTPVQSRYLVQRKNKRGNDSLRLTGF